MEAFTVETVQAYIAKPRVPEMLARGWRILGPGGEGALLMEGPDPDAAPQGLQPLEAPRLGRLWQALPGRRGAAA